MWSWLSSWKGAVKEAGAGTAEEAVHRGEDGGDRGRGSWRRGRCTLRSEGMDRTWGGVGPC